MISPQYTPFSEDEVRGALGMMRPVYTRAVGAGKLERSVHFNCRVSKFTGMHSLVDVVRYDVLFRQGWGNHGAIKYAEHCDHWLDELCNVNEEEADFEQLAIEGNQGEILLRLLPESDANVLSGTAAIWSEELAFLIDVVSSWCQCYRLLKEILASDRSMAGRTDLRAVSKELGL